MAEMIQFPELEASLTFSYTQRSAPNSVITVEYAGFWMRFAAHVIDGLILGSIVLAISMIALYFGDTFDNGYIIPVSDPFLRDTLYWQQLLITAIVYLPYHIGFWLWRGQTPGKMVLNLKIVRSDGNRLDLLRAVVRYAGWFATGFFLFSILYLWIAFDGRKQGIHDKLAGTCVVKLPPRSTRMMSIYD